MLRFDDLELAAELERLSAKGRALFAASCAQRLLEAHARCATEPESARARQLELLMERLWADLEGEAAGREELERALDRCIQLIPLSGASPEPGRVGAEDAAAAVAFALRCRSTGQAAQAVWAARNTFEAFELCALGCGPVAAGQAEAQEEPSSHPLVQLELARQRRDLEELALRSPGAPLLRARSRSEGARLFRGPPDPAAVAPA